MCSGWSGGRDLKEEGGIVAVIDVGEEGGVPEGVAEIGMTTGGRRKDQNVLFDDRSHGGLKTLGVGGGVEGDGHCSARSAIISEKEGFIKLRLMVSVEIETHECQQ